MRCSKCGCENESGSNFCVQCGGNLEMKKEAVSSNKVKTVIKRASLIIAIIFSAFILMFSVLIMAVGLSESETALAVIGGIFFVASLISLVFASKENARYINKKLTKKEVADCKVSALVQRIKKKTELLKQQKNHRELDKSSFDKSHPVGFELSPIDKINNLVVYNPSISLVQDETCYYRGDASAVHQKNVVTGHINRGTGGSIRIAKGMSVRVGGGTSQAIRENINEYYKGTLYITNYRIILLAPKYGFDLFVSKITQLNYKPDGIQIYCGAKCYSAYTHDVSKIREIIELLNDQKVFKDEKHKSTDKNNLSKKTTTELRELKSLLDDGVITQEEFDAKKKQLLGL